MNSSEIIIHNNKKQNNESAVPFVFITDDAYVIPTAVAVCSLIKNSNNKKSLQIIIIYSDISEDNKQRLLQIALECQSLELIHFESNIFNKFDNKKLYVSSTALIKFELCNILKDYDKIVYLDGDILVEKDLTTLTQIDTKNSYCAAVQDFDSSVRFGGPERLGIPFYFNSGVMVLNLKKIRDEKLSSKMLTIKMERKDLYYMDQDVLNIAFSRAVKLLPIKYNFISDSFKDNDYTIQEINNFYKTEYNHIQDLKKDVCINHLAGKIKPWKFTNSPSHNEWMSYYTKSVYQDMTLQFNSNHSNNSIVKNLLSKIMRLFTKTSGINNKGDWEIKYSIIKIPIIVKTRTRKGIESRLFGFILIQKNA